MAHQRGTVAASAWSDAHGAPAHPKELDPADFIGHRFASGLNAAWEFERRKKIIRLTPAGRQIATSAAIGGLGLINTFEELLRPAIDASRLVPVLEEWCVEFPGPSLYYPSRRQLPSKLRVFVDFLRADSGA